ncbi:hypothetical protein HPG69_000801 [Diceros bicornis minor]|uniref:Uncharacterized protein n=1 Tax=Diceros bicornis minor TaxID=77932 RepID=A0A7J7E723_DICBM|nr:hypothetical protein HPG69_000801 [Diceros bicornis minor]
MATAPAALFATASSVGVERLCLLRFPDGGPDSLALYHLQKIAVGFAYLFLISICLAHSNSCLNPLLYCQLRRNVRQSVRELRSRNKRPADFRPSSHSRALQPGLNPPERRASQ